MGGREWCEEWRCGIVGSELAIDLCDRYEGEKLKPEESGSNIKNIGKKRKTKLN